MNIKIFIHNQKKCSHNLIELIQQSKFIVSFSGALTKSQFPVFTIYAQKSCLGVKPCEKSWCIDRVQGYKLTGFTKSTQAVNTRQECFEMCLGETEFTCR